jgi:D-psicose/D-tagatose/L-ribulose 3-epimerase
MPEEVTMATTPNTTFGAHAFVWTAQWDAQGAERAITGAAAQGLDFVEVPLLDLEGFPLEATRALAEAHGVAITTSLGLPAACHMPFNPDGALHYLTSAIELTAALSSDTLTGALYTHLGTLTRKPPTEDEIEICATTIKRAAHVAAGHGIQLGLEAINRYETYLNNTAAQLADLIDRIDEPNVFAHLDTYHMNIEEKGFRAPIELLGEQLQYVHLAESDRGTPGSGNVHWDDVFAGLQSIGYRGRLAMESFVAVNEAIIGATAIWREIVGDPDTLIRDGLAFLRGKSRDYDLLETHEQQR